ncbi:MAG: hypothetical protein LW875_04200 [Proteobacteria bacterium]|jgi:hypothetical protein|nr:hypothetical protein [Pseudomonadota bacterium]
MKWKLSGALFILLLAYVGTVRILEPELPAEILAVLQEIPRKALTEQEQNLLLALETPYGFKEEFKIDNYSDPQKYLKDTAGKISFSAVFETNLSLSHSNSCEIVFTHWSRFLSLEENDTARAVAEIQRDPRPFYKHMQKKVRFYVHHLGEEIPFIEKLMILSILSKIGESFLKVQSQGPLWTLPQEIRSLLASLDREKILRSSKVAEMRGAACLLKMSKGSRLSLSAYLIQKNVVLIDVWKKWETLIEHCGRLKKCEAVTELKKPFNPFYPLRQLYLTWLSPRGNFHSFSEKVDFLRSFSEPD